MEFDPAHYGLIYLLFILSKKNLEFHVGATYTIFQVIQEVSELRHLLIFPLPAVAGLKFLRPKKP
jgi:hypothetical protein